MKPCKITAHSDKHSDDIFLQGIRVVQMCCNFVTFYEIINKRDAKKFQISILTNKKVLFLKKYELSQVFKKDRVVLLPRLWAAWLCGQQYPKSYYWPELLWLPLLAETCEICLIEVCITPIKTVWLKLLYQKIIVHQRK